MFYRGRSCAHITGYAIILIVYLLSAAACYAAQKQPWQLVKIRTMPNRGIARWQTKIGVTPVSYNLKINESSVDVRSTQIINGKNYQYGHRITFFTPPRSLQPGMKLDFPIRVQSTAETKKYSGPSIITWLTSKNLRIESGHVKNQLTSMYLRQREVNRSDLKATITVGPWLKSEAIELTMNFKGGGFDKAARASITWVYARPRPGEENSPPQGNVFPKKVRALPSQGAPPFNETREYAAFQGLLDPAISIADWDRLLNYRIDELVNAAFYYPGVHNFLEVPNEQHRWLIETYRQVGYYFRDLLNRPGPKRESEIFWHLWLSGDPGKQALEGSENYPYAAVTKKTMWDLYRRILASGGDQLEPADVMRLALDSTGGNYPLAVLTAHNLLKTITERGRFVIITANDARRQNKRLYNRKFDSFRRDLGQYGPFVKRLASLRRDPNRVRDKMGPWYHLFAVLTASGVASPGSSEVAAFGEHLMKAASFFDNEGGFNREKATIDTRFAYAAANRLSELSRNYRYIERFDTFRMVKPYGWTVREDSASGGTVFTSPVSVGSSTPLSMTILVTLEPDADYFFEMLFSDIERSNPSLRLLAQGNRVLNKLNARWRKYAAANQSIYFTYTSRPYRDSRAGRVQVILVSIAGSKEAYHAYGSWATGLLRTIQFP